MPAGALQLDGARPQQRAAASAAAAAITAVQQPQQPAAPAPVLLEAARAAQPPISMTAALDPVSDLSMALSSEADAAHAAAVAAVVPLLRVAADPAVAAAIKQGLKQLYAAVREGASVPEAVLQAITGSLRGLAVPACGTTAAIPTAAPAAAAPTSTGKKRKHGTAIMAAAAAAAEADNSKKQKVQKPSPAVSDGRPGVWLDEDEAGDDACWVQLGDHVFMEVDADTFMRDPASFKVAAAAAATTAEYAGGAAGSSSKRNTNKSSSSNKRNSKSSRNKHSSSSSSSSSSTHLIWLFRVERFEGNFIKGRFYQNAARDLAQPLQLQRKLQELCSDKISSILHVLQPSETSSSKALETLTRVEAEWLQEVQLRLS